ncbi:MAG: DUF2807 domain-containing protein [Ferruginibacter sp.]
MKLTAIITAFVLTATGFSATAAGTNNETGSTNKVSYQSSFNKIVVQDGIELRLTESSEKSMQFSGSDADVKKVDWKIQGNTLYIKSKKGSLKAKVTIELSVNQLKALHVLGNSDIISAGELKSNNLEVYVDGGGVIALQSRGSIYIEQASGTELDVKKSEGDVTIK